LSNVVFKADLRRVSKDTVEATSGTGGRVTMGPKGTPDSFTPVELLLAAIAGCSGIDMCTVGERDGIDLGHFTLELRATKPLDAERLENIQVQYSTPDASPDVVARLVDEVSSLCTVALTVSHGCPVTHELSNRPRRSN
jgi:putative redox protein